MPDSRCPNCNALLDIRPLWLAGETTCPVCQSELALTDVLGERVEAWKNSAEVDPAQIEAFPDRVAKPAAAPVVPVEPPPVPFDATTLQRTLLEALDAFGSGDTDDDEYRVGDLLAAELRSILEELQTPDDDES